MSFRRFAIVVALALAGCGSIYEEPLPAATDARALADVAGRLPPDEARLLELWGARGDAAGGRTVGQVLTDERQTQYLTLKARADVAENRCIQSKSGNPRFDDAPMTLATDPLQPKAAHPAALPPCEAMAYYKRQLAAIDRMTIPAGAASAASGASHATIEATPSVVPAHAPEHTM